MIKQAKNLQVGDVIYVAQIKQILTISSANNIKMPMGFLCRLIYKFKDRDFRVIFKPTDSIPVIGQAKIN